MERSAAPISGEPVRDTVRRALPSPGALAALAFPGAPAPGALLAAFPDDFGFRWRSPETALEATGAVARVGPDEAPALLDSVAGAPVRLVGGLPFGTRAGRPDPSWAPFGGPGLVLPRWSATRDARGDRLVRVLSGDDDPDAVMAELDRIRACVPRRRPLPAVVAIAPASRWDWARHVEAIRSEIRRGRFDKLVAARATDLRFDGPVDAWTVFERLRAANAGCHLFLLRAGDATFLGASPETLLAKRGDQLVTHALAGSRRADDPSLHDSPKNRHEHELVVLHIREALAPFAARTAVSALRERPVGDIVHLETPIRATLRPGTSPLAVARALHPTPAVGGLPHRAAHEWILRHEPLDRGWYAGALGWVDGAGDAELAVALRSGLVAGDRARAYAGAGIVEASDADAEYDETALKSGPLLRALGVA